jgi:hypothetical protein
MKCNSIAALHLAASAAAASTPRDAHSTQTIYLSAAWGGDASHSEEVKTLQDSCTANALMLVGATVAASE